MGELPPICKDNGAYLAKVDLLDEKIKQEVQSWKANGAPVWYRLPRAILLSSFHCVS